MSDDLGGLPNWYREIFPAGAHDGFFQKFGDHSAAFVERSPEQLVVSFDNLSDAGNPRYDREPWAAKFCRDNGWSHLGIFSQGPTWFRSAPLIAMMQALRDDGFFARFGRVTLCGASMGGFGALAFSDLAPGATVLAFSPQSTLDQTIVPWENRFQKGHGRDWGLPFSDAADHVSKAGKLYIVYDPMDAGDKRHVERLKSDKIIPLRAIGLGHKSALTMRRMDQLKEVMSQAIAGTLTPQTFHGIAQNRKNLYLYRKTIEGYLLEAKKDALLDRFRKAFKRRNRQIALARQAAAADENEPEPVARVSEPLVATPWPTEPGNIWMLDTQGSSMRYLSDRWNGKTLGFEERDGVTHAQTSPAAIGVLALGDGVAIERQGTEPHPWHVVDETMSGHIPQFAAAAHGNIALQHATDQQETLPTIMAISQPQPGVMEAEALPGSDAYAQVLSRLETACETLIPWGKSLFVDRICLSLLAGEAGMGALEADAHYSTVAKALRETVPRLTGQNSFPHVIISQSAGSDTDGTSEVILAEGRLDIAHPGRGFIVAGPKYPYPLMDGMPATHAPDATALIDELEVIALREVHRGARWYCPSLQEAAFDGAAITAKFFSLSDLVLGDGDHGFSLRGCSNKPAIKKVETDGTQVMILCDKVPEGPEMELCYAWGHRAKGGSGHSANRGALSDTWHAESLVIAGRTLRRYALSGKVRLQPDV